jgi:hypothetical protein
VALINLVQEVGTPMWEEISPELELETNLEAVIITMSISEAITVGMSISILIIARISESTTAAIQPYGTIHTGHIPGRLIGMADTAIIAIIHITIILIALSIGVRYGIRGVSL